MECRVGHKRDRHLELVRERADDRHHQQRDQQVAAALDVAEPGAHRMRRAGGAHVGAVQLRGVHRQQADQRSCERSRVDDEALAHPEQRDDHAAGRRADHARRRHDRRVDPDRPGERRTLNQFGDKRLARWRVERTRDPEAERQDPDHPKLDDAGQRQDPERQREQPLRRLRDDQQPSLVDSVGDRPRPRAEDQDRDGLQRDRQAERAAAGAQLEHQPCLGDGLQPRPRNRDQLAGEVQPVVARA